MEWGEFASVCVLGGRGRAEGLENAEEAGCKCRKNTSWIQTDTFIYIGTAKKDHLSFPVSQKPDKIITMLTTSALRSVQLTQQAQPSHLLVVASKLKGVPLKAKHLIRAEPIFSSSLDTFSPEI